MYSQNFQKHHTCNEQEQAQPTTTRTTMMQPQSNYYYNGQQYDPDDKSPLIQRNNTQNGEGARQRKNHPKQSQSSGLTSPMSFGGSPASYDSDDYINSKGNNKQRKTSVRRSFISLCGCCPKSRNSAEEEDQHFYQDDFNDQSWSCSFGRLSIAS